MLTTISKIIWSINDKTGLKLCVFDLKAEDPFNHKLCDLVGNDNIFLTGLFWNLNDYILDHNSTWLLVDN